MDSLFEKRDPISGIVNIHLISGEDYIAKVTEVRTEFDDMLRMENPVIPNISTGDGTNFKVGLMPLRPYLSKEPVLISRSAIAWSAPVSEQMANLYRQYTGDIVIAGANELPKGRSPLALG